MLRVRSLNLTKEAHDFIRALEAKQFKQVMGKILALLSDPAPADSSPLKGYEGLLRVDMGEHRIVYRFDEKAVSVLVVDKRNDDEVYKKLARKKL
ncbi:MAG: type II toxin-antitoxin system RelE/ParE family toxin [Cyanobacteria bacterium SZAS LIN-3]|nr:type II toxin-antitoxin system RelE/ParE family toxin [Cyanobacteria bacterium SZAS LIN-3]